MTKGPARQELRPETEASKSHSGIRSHPL
ncbi:hypothetical protein SUNI508_14093, partial [Seiridium unicorne]